MVKNLNDIAWKRLLAEGSAIVVSILLAFAIDASWDKRQERGRELEALLALRTEFEENRRKADEVMDAHRAAEDRIARLLTMSEPEILGLEQDSLVVFVGSLAAPYSFDPVRGTVDALIGAGELDLLQEAELRQALTAFLNATEDAEEDAAFMGEFAVRAWGASIRHGGPWDAAVVLRRSGRLPFLPQPTARTLADIRQDQELMGFVRQLRFLAWVYMGELEVIQSRIDAVLAHVEPVGR